MIGFIQILPHCCQSHCCHWSHCQSHNSEKNKNKTKTLNNLLVCLSYQPQIIYKLHEIVSLFCTYNQRRTDQADNQQKKKLHLAPQTVSGPLIVRAACMPQERITVNSFLINKILSLCSLPSSWSLQRLHQLLNGIDVPTLLSHFKGVLLRVRCGRCHGSLLRQNQNIGVSRISLPNQTVFLKSCILFISLTDLRYLLKTG